MNKMVMDSWVPLFEIFLNSPCPENDASLWLQRSFNSSSNTTPISTTSFLSLLTKPSEATAIEPSSPPQKKRVMWIQTLPDLVQARILSFLVYDHQRFCKKDLCQLARMLSGEEGLHFWVKRAAQQLLDVVSVSDYQWISHLNLDSEDENVDHEFHSLPDFLSKVAQNSEPLFSWIPVLPDALSQRMIFNSSESNGEDSFISFEDRKCEDNIDEVMEEVDMDKLKSDDTMDADIENKAKFLKDKVLNLDSASTAVNLSDDIRGLCHESGANCLEVLQLIEPWNADDELAAVLISNLSNGNKDELGWASYVLCSIVLPKFLVLKEPPSRVLMAAAIEHCKAHQRSAEYALLFPLILQKEGINSPICDVISRIVKECLHPAHVSAFCQKLLCSDKDMKRFICLPCHRHLVSDELVCTESFFSLLLNLLNHNVHLTQDSVDQLIHLVRKCTERYSKSLKFGNFLLCLVNKCGSLLNPHKILLTAAVEQTNTIVTKSIISRLSVL